MYHSSNDTGFWYPQQMHIEDIVRFKDNGTVTIGPDARVAEAAGIMAERYLGMIVVCSQDGQVIGVISERDIIRAVAQDSRNVSDLEVSQLITKNPITCALEDDIRDVFAIMQKQRFRHMPVIQHGKLAGMVSAGDILKFLDEESEMEKRALIYSYLEFL